jgi:hypothetical protein
MRAAGIRPGLAFGDLGVLGQGELGHYYLCLPTPRVLVSTPWPLARYTTPRW